MKYEFHVGDYVEAKANSFGYINCADNDEVSWYCVYDADGYRAGEEYYVAGIEGNELSRYYNRIGQYDFTKPEHPKEITKLNPGWRGDEAYRKINELIDAVNELRKEERT